MIQVVPAILRVSYATLAERAALVAGLVPLVQVDVVDGIYAPEPTWPYAGDTEGMFEKLQSGEERLPLHDRLKYEADLLIQNPELSLDSWIHAGFKQIVIHFESTKHLDDIIVRLRGAPCTIGLAFKPETSLEVITPWISKVDFVQCMGNDRVGQTGVPLDPKVLHRVSRLRAQFPELLIGVDIGVNFETAPKLIAAGVTRLVAGSAIFESGNPELAIRRLGGEAV